MNHGNTSKLITFNCMQNLESFLVQRITPYDQRIRALTSSIENKEAELDILGLAYQDLLQNLEKLVGPEKFSECIKQLNVATKCVSDLSKAEQLLLIKMFDLNVPVPDTDYETLERLKKFKELVQKTNGEDLINGPLFQAIVNSPEFEMIINSPDFALLAAHQELTALVKNPQFRKLAGSNDFHQILKQNGLTFPFRVTDGHLHYKISLLRSIAKLDRIFDDFAVNRCASEASFEDSTSNPFRTPLFRMMSPRKTDTSLKTKPTGSVPNIAMKDKLPLNVSAISSLGPDKEES